LLFPKNLTYFCPVNPKSTDLLTEGVDFDLTYFPLKHLGYKAVTVAGSDILAMNARPSQLMVSLGVSAKMSVEALQELYEGIAFACREFRGSIWLEETRRLR